MAFLTKDQILASRDNRKTQIVEVPEWFDNGEVIIIELTGKQRDAFENEMIEIRGKGKHATQHLNLKNIRAKLAARCIVDPEDFDIVTVSIEQDTAGVSTIDVTELSNEAALQNALNTAKAARKAVLKSGHVPKRYFTDIEANDLGDTSAIALNRVFEACQHLSGITNDDVDELVGEMGNGQSGDSGLN